MSIQKTLVSFFRGKEAERQYAERGNSEVQIQAQKRALKQYISTLQIRQLLMEIRNDWKTGAVDPTVTILYPKEEFRFQDMQSMYGALEAKYSYLTAYHDAGKRDNGDYGSSYYDDGWKLTTHSRGLIILTRLEPEPALSIGRTWTGIYGQETAPERLHKGRNEAFVSHTHSLDITIYREALIALPQDPDLAKKIAAEKISSAIQTVEKPQPAKDSANLLIAEHFGNPKYINLRHALFGR